MGRQALLEHCDAGVDKCSEGQRLDHQGHRRSGGGTAHTQGKFVLWKPSLLCLAQSVTFKQNGGRFPLKYIQLLQPLNAFLK